MNNEHYDEIGRTEDFSMMDGMFKCAIFIVNFFKWLTKIIIVNKQKRFIFFLSKLYSIKQTYHTIHPPDIPCFAEEVILHTESDLHGHEEITEGVALNNIYEVALENEIYLDQGSSLKYG